MSEKVCPVMSISCDTSKPAVKRECLKEDCAWYFKKYKQCAVLIIAKALSFHAIIEG